MPHEVINYINELDETSLKTLILIFSENRVLSNFELSEKLKKSIPEIDHALKNLESKKIIVFPSQNSAEFTENSAGSSQIEQPSSFQITAEDMGSFIKTNPKAKTLYEGAEKIYSRPLTSTETRGLTFIAQIYSNMEIDAILMAVNYCYENKKAFPQIEKMCEKWSNEGILTYSQAKKQIKILLEQSKIENKVKRCFGLVGRSLSSNEKNYIAKWTKSYNFNIYMIKEAFDRCIDSTGQLSFPYIDKIMCDWHSNNVKTEQQLKSYNYKYNNLYKNKSRNGRNLNCSSNRRSYINREIIAKIDEQCKKRDEAFMQAKLKCMGIAD